jgi:hypothetical protein
VIDLGIKSHVQRLYTAIDSSRRARQPFRRKRVQMLKEFVGSHYNDSGAPHEVLVNLLNMTADVYTIGLAARTPRVQVRTDFRELAPFANHYTQNINNFIKEIRFVETLQALVLDAFFADACAKVFLAEWQSVQLEDDVWADPGRPYVKRISPDDFGLDMTAKDVRSCKFIWDEYRVSWDSVRTNPFYDKAVVKQLSPSSKWERDEEQASGITNGSIVDDDEYEPKICLMDVWLPELEKVAICARHAPLKPLQLVEAGPEGGPYHFLNFADVPDNVPSTSPAQNLMGLHLLYNGLMRKQARQAKRQKTNPTYNPSATEDAARMKRVNDGDWVKVNDPSGINVVNQGGVDQGNVAFSIGVLDLFDRQAGNLQAMAGLGPQAPTLGQEQLIYSATSRKEAKMQHRVHRFTADLMRSIGQLMWVDEILQIETNIKPRKDSLLSVHSPWTPEYREGDFWQYNFDVEPYSMIYEPPEARAQKMERAMDRIANLYPMLQQMGGTIDVQQLVRNYAETLDLPELERIVIFPEPLEGIQPAGPGFGNHERSMAPETTRNYVRKNVPTGGTPQAQSDKMKQAWLSGANGNGNIASGFTG